MAQTVRQLEQDLGRSMLVIQTLLRICQEKGMFNKQEFMAKLQQIDIEDGKLDGKLARSRAPLVCTHCGKTNNHSATSCMYCGGVLAPQSPSPAVWRAIEQRLWPQDTPVAAASWWQRLAVWRALAGLATAAVFGLAVMVANPPVQAPVIIVLQGTAGGAGAPSFVASLSGDGRALVTQPIRPVALQADLREVNGDTEGSAALRQRADSLKSHVHR